jgi:Lon-like ATP-dependent protease
VSVLYQVYDQALAAEIHKTKPKKVAVLFAKNDAREFHKIGILAHVENLSGSPNAVELRLVGENRVRVLDEKKLYVCAEDLNDTIGAQVNQSILKAQLVDACLEYVSGEHSGSNLNGLINQLKLNQSQFTVGELSDAIFGVICGEASKLEIGSILNEVDAEGRTRKVISALQRLTKIRQSAAALLENDEHLVQSGLSKHYQQSLSPYVEKLLHTPEFSSESDLYNFHLRMTKLDAPPHVEKVFKQEIQKFKEQDPSHSEHQTIRNYLDWITSMPWNVYSDDNLDVEKAKAVLNQDHYGLEDVKKRILEFIAVGSLKGDVTGRILCFAGPPGVGKTSIGESIAKSLGRKFERISIGGVDDVSEIKGHRRTYVGAVPGRIISCLKRCETSNPVILIDEIDKCVKTHRGDPAAALLEALDPSQNKNFHDNYLDVDYDLSKVLFLATANDLDSIPKPLLDRLEIIEISGYIPTEKIEIAKNYLIPKSLKSCGLAETHAKFDDLALEKLIHLYCREPGVRSLQRYIDRIFRKIAYKVATFPKDQTWETLNVTPENLIQYAGVPNFSETKMYSGSFPPGVVNRLGYGGSVSSVECIVVGTKAASGSLKLTGHVKQVMSESTSVAWSFCKKFLKEQGLHSYVDFFKDKIVHMHFPEGHVPKNSPHGGISVVTSLLSLALNQPVSADVVMSGEITLNGKIMPVTQLKEKVIGAIRADLKVLLLPVANQSEFESLPKDIVEGLNVKFVENYSEVFERVFQKPAANEKDVKQEQQTSI